MSRRNEVTFSFYHSKEYFELIRTAREKARLHSTYGRYLL